MKLTRRDFFATSSVALGTFSRAFGQTPPVAAPPPPQTSFDPLRGNVGIFTGRGGTIGMLVAPDGIVVVDTQFADTAAIALGNLKQMSRAADRLPHQHAPPRRSHVRQYRVPACGGEACRAPQRARTAKAQAAAAKSEAQQAYADTTFDTTWSAKVGTETVNMKYYGPGHTSGDSVARFRMPTWCTWAT